MKHTVSRRTLSFLLAMALVVSLFAGLTMTASAANLTGTPTGYTKASDVVYDTSGTYLKNWGARGENCTFLTTYAHEVTEVLGDQYEALVATSAISPPSTPPRRSPAPGTAAPPGTASTSGPIPRMLTPTRILTPTIPRIS